MGYRLSLLCCSHAFRPGGERCVLLCAAAAPQIIDSGQLRPGTYTSSAEYKRAIAEERQRLKDKAAGGKAR